MIPPGEGMKETPMSSGQARMNALMAALHLVVYYGIALTIWGLALRQNVLWFAADIHQFWHGRLHLEGKFVLSEASQNLRVVKPLVADTVHCMNRLN